MPIRVMLMAPVSLADCCVVMALLLPTTVTAADARLPSCWVPIVLEFP